MHNLAPDYLTRLLFLTKIHAYSFMYSLATSTILVPYAFTAFYRLKHQECDGTAGRRRNMVIGAVASLYAVWLVYAAGLTYLLLAVLLYAPAIVVYVLMRIKNREKIFTIREFAAATALVAVCRFCIYRIVTGQLVMY